MSATDVFPRNEFSYGTSDPTLWIFAEEGNYDTVRKTAAQINDLTPSWSESFCFDGASTIDFRLCFEIRDDYDPGFPKDRPPLLHSGCVDYSLAYGVHTASLSGVSQVQNDGLPVDPGTATLSFTISPHSPPSPPLAPEPRAPPPDAPLARGGRVAQLNAVFRRPDVAGGLASAGVILHQFDAMDDPNPDHRPWEPGRARVDTKDRISAALVNSRMTPDPGGNIPLYSFDLAGLILSAEYNQFSCSYPYDVGTTSRRCSAVWGTTPSCTPGCSSFDGDTRNWCDANSDSWKWINPACPWRPADLPKMMEAREEVRANEMMPPGKVWNDHKYYVEMVFDSEYYMNHLPHSILGVFYIDGNCGDAYDGPKCQDYARGAHRAMMSNFDLDPIQFPLVKLDLFNWKTPFTDDSPLA